MLRNPNKRGPDVAVDNENTAGVIGPRPVRRESDAAPVATERYSKDQLFSSLPI
jgi:hypothetical protein